MVNKKMNKGITLIALVITIIVILILAGVSITALTGENSTIMKANQANTETKKGATKEKIELKVLGSLDKFGKLSKEELNRNLRKIDGIKGIPIEEFPATVTLNGYNIIIDKNGKVTLDGKVVQDDEQFEVGSEEDLENKADKVIEGSTLAENWVKAIDIYGNEVDMANWYYESNTDGTFILNTTSNIDNDIAGYKGSIVNNTIVGEIPAYIIKCTNGVIEKGKVGSLECAFANITNLTKLKDTLKIPPEIYSLAGLLMGTGITEIPKNLCDMGNNVKYINIMFKNCTQLTEIRSEFKIGENVTDAPYLFEGTSITTLPETFKLNDNVVNIEGMFYKSKLQEIEKFDITSPVKNARLLFSGTLIKEVPSTLTFNSNVWYTPQMFESCKQLETISPEFRLPIYVTDVNAMFSGCSKLTSIPNEFKLPPTVKTARYMFNVCEMLKAIPDDFVIPDLVTDCSYMFATCWRMETIGNGFKIGTGVTNAEGMFQQCGNLKNINITVPSNVENINKIFLQGNSNQVTGNITLEGIPTQYNQAFYNMGISNTENLVNVYVKDNNLLNSLKTTVGEGKVNFSLKT